ncbi:Sulfite reductase, dissimilatory-type subunit gamma [subsurface metagenome]
MAKVSALELVVRIDEDGFMLEPQKWNKEVAGFLAQQEGLESLTEDHWRLIDCVRDYYQRFEVAPPIRLICKTMGVNVKYLYELFPSGFAKGVCKVAGLPKPDPHVFGHPREDC